MSKQSFKNICRLLDTVKEEVAPEQAFLSDLKRSIELTSDKESREPSRTYKPSSMNCIRNMYYQVVGEEQDTSSSVYTLVGICNAGTDIHERVQKYVAGMKDNDMDCEYIDVAQYIKDNGLEEHIDIVDRKGMETKLYHKVYNMSFLCDGIIKYRGKYYILEIKTESSYKWQSRKGVDPKHYAQGISYSVAFKIDGVIFLYISRDILDMKAFMFTPTQEQKNEVIERILTCDSYVAKKEVPPKPQDLPRTVCEYCSYKSACRMQGED